MSKANTDTQNPNPQEVAAQNTDNQEKVLINCDMGESFGLWQMGHDEKIMPFIDAANIACGFHAGDPEVMVKTLTLALKYNVKPGAHPGYPDKQGFGRRSMQLKPNELEHMLWYQVGALSSMAKALGTALYHVKPHGALYNDMMRNEVILQQVMAAISRLDLNLKLMIQATPNWQRHASLAKQHDIEILFEAFADRGYQNNSLLVPRKDQGALLSTEMAIAQSLSILQQQKVTSVDGHTIDLQVDTLCIHGDGQNALKIAKALR